MNIGFNKMTYFYPPIIHLVMIISRFSRAIVFAVLLTCSAVIAMSFAKPKQLKQKQAVKKAEDFIRRNGYTEAPLDTSIYPLTFEHIEATLDIRTLLNARRSSLHPKAFCIMHDSIGWRIGFLSTIVDATTLDAAARKTDLPGRTVTIFDNGGEMRVEHADPQFSKYKKL
jgi:hypothetical protein